MGAARGPPAVRSPSLILGGDQRATCTLARLTKTRPFGATQTSCRRPFPRTSRSTILGCDQKCDSVCVLY
jgi:hypothetical protein